MELKDILSKCDHTLLSQTATWDEIRGICDDGMKYGCASVCIPASYVKQAAEYAAGRLPICTVIGFPNGYDTTAAKCFMATDAVNNGASEVDMVINLGWVKDRKWDDLLSEIKAVKEACHGKLLKVIIECCFLTDEEKIKMCEIVTASGADYIKTSTGFGGRRRHPGGRGPLCKARRPQREDQGCRRHRRFAGRGGFYQSGSLPSGYQPCREGREGHGKIRRMQHGNTAQ